MVNSPARLRIRLLPLYMTVFLQGFVLWYATEKLFMTTIGFDGTTIGLMVALYSAVIVVAETPSGILADRWSRKGVAMVASMALAISGLISGLSDSVLPFLIGACFWGVYFAMYSGTYESMLYDTILEETGTTDNFQRYLGILYFFHGAALIISSLAGGLIAQYVGLRDTYLYTIPFALISIIALLPFREPGLHKSPVAIPIRQHVQDTFRAVFRRQSLAAILIVLITAAILSYIILEFDQLWLIALGVSAVFYGPVNALVLGSYSLGGAVGARLGLHKLPVLIVLIALALGCAVNLIVVHAALISVGCLSILLFILTVLTINFTRQLHDSLDSKVRAGATSAVSSAGRIIIIPVALLFGYVSQRTNVFNAAWILVVLLLMTVIFAHRSFQNSKD